jgi:hypothetical protein
MTPTRLTALLPTVDTVAVFGAVTIGSVLLDLVAPMNVILFFFFIVSVFLNWTSGIMKAYAVHHRSGSKEKWFSVPHAVFGFVKKIAMLMFALLAGVMDGTLMIAEWSAGAAQHTPTVKAVFVAMNGALCIRAAQNLRYVIGEDARLPLAVLLRHVDREHADGPLPHQRVTDPIVDAHLPEKERDL